MALETGQKQVVHICPDMKPFQDVTYHGILNEYKMVCGNRHGLW